MGNRLTGPASPKPLNYSQDYTYDSENRLTRVVKHSGQNTDTITFKYDPFGRRIEKNVSTVENSIPTTYKYTYVYDNEDIILEVLDKTQNGTTTTTTTSYVHGPGIDEPLSLERNSQKYYYHADGLGSITSMTDSTQAVVNRYSYDSFGNVQRAETVWNDFTYTGREYDIETGQYYLRARYYNPETGKFISKDPIGFAGGDVNLYSYTSSNPINYIDPYGLEDTSIDAAIKQAIGRGDVEELETLFDATGNQAARAGINRLNTRASQLIAKECKGSINREFPGEMLDKTFGEITKLANQGVKAAQKAKKLLTDTRFRK